MTKKSLLITADTVADLLQKVTTPASRAGYAIERVGRMLEAGVSPNVIALQMTENSPQGNIYTAAKVEAYGELYQDSKTKAPITAAQTRAIIEEQYAQDFGDERACSV